MYAFDYKITPSLLSLNSFAYKDRFFQAAITSRGKGLGSLEWRVSTIAQHLYELYISNDQGSVLVILPKF